MLKKLNLNSIEDLFSYINKEIRVSNSGMNLPEGITELEASKILSQMALMNNNTENFISFLGGGTYKHFIPACVSSVTDRCEFLTSYTPYQPEVSQGTLQAIFDYQSLICSLTGMDVSNASVYDGATACAEAVLMASRLTKKSKIFLSKSINPEYLKVIETYCYASDIEIEYLDILKGKTDITQISAQKIKDSAGILIQNPNYFGCVEDVFEINEIISGTGTKFIVCADPLSFALLKNPSEYKADIVVGDFQSFGISMSFGGPHGGFIACKEAYLRQLPGRIAGLTKDKNNQDSFTLTLQTREQHIRREKATSNICTNNALMALAATVYLSVMGPEGLKEVLNLSIQRAHYMAEKLNKIPGFKILFNNFLYEFVLKIDGISPETFIKKMAEEKIFIGINLEDKFPEMQGCLLVCVTEMNRVEDIDKTCILTEKILGQL
jgi:glycine dehydrogenase subunit 1